MHSAGVLFAGVTIAFYALARRDDARRFRFTLLASVFVWLCGAWYVRHLTSSDHVGFVFNPITADASAWSEFRKNVATAGRVSAAWVLSFGGGGARMAERMSSVPIALVGLGIAGVMGALCRRGFQSIDRSQQRRLTGLAALLLLLTIASVFYVVPGYPAPMFVRSWVFLAVLSAALIGRGLEDLAVALASSATRSVPVVAMSAILVVLLGLRASGGAVALVVLRDSMAERGDLQFDTDQPALLGPDATASSSVLYLAETPLYLYLTHGANRSGAVFYPAVAKGADADRWLDGNAALRYVVGLSPAAGLVLRDGDAMVIEAPGTAMSHAEILIDSPSRMAVTATPISGESHRQERVSSPSPTWVAIDGELPVRVSVTGAGRGVHVHGVRYDSHARLHWPWNSGTTLTVTRAAGGGAQAIQFDSMSWTRLGNRRGEVVSDRGDSVLMRVR